MRFRYGTFDPARKRNEWRARVDAAAAGTTLAAFVARRCLVAEADARDLVDFGSVHVDGRQDRDPDRVLEGGSEVRVFWPWHGVRRFYQIDPGRILYQDRHILIYNKETGIPTQQTPSDGYNNVYDGLKRYLAGVTGRSYVALHHRLDMETSGAILFSLDSRVNRPLARAFQQRRISKDYLAWVHGRCDPPKGVIRGAIGRHDGCYCVRPDGQGKPAETRYWVLRERAGRSLVWVKPVTGRTHQIRLHFASLDHPVVGDGRYGSCAAPPIMLHAYRISLEHPVDGCRLQVIAPLPQHWRLRPGEPSSQRSAHSAAPPVH